MLQNITICKMICLLFCKIPRQQRRHITTLCDIEQNTQRCGGWHILYLTVYEKGVGSSPSCVSFRNFVCNILYCFSKAVSLMCLKHLRCRFKPYTACNVPLTYMQSPFIRNSCGL
nr:MAG TPA: hypothetical protein [Caudoviricetes sp.]